MKAFIKHEQTCQIKAARGCSDCKRANALLTLHARSCKLEECVVPKCHEIREQIKQVTMRQQAMDDRRSAMMR
jgi:E1A/CREB-binding protein